MDDLNMIKPVGDEVEMMALLRQSHQPGRRRDRWWKSLIFHIILGVIITGGLLFLAVCVMRGVATKDDGLFDIMRAAVTALGVITIGGGAVIAYNRQVSLEEQADLQERQAVLEREKADLEHSKEGRALRTEDRAGRAELHARYQQAAAQLGHEKSMIRIAGVYALEALAKEWDTLDDGLAQRDVCIDLLCGYLKSKPEFEDTATDIENGASTKAPVMTAGEADVRLAITTVINRNLHTTDDPKKPGVWSDHDYDFRNAFFASDTIFNMAIFKGNALFIGAIFAGAVNFSGARFTRTAHFSQTFFYGHALFNGVEFAGGASFGAADFNDAQFFDASDFGSAKFGTGKDGTTRSGNTYFMRVTFHKEVSFMETDFISETFFVSTKFNDGAWFRGDFTGIARFNMATFGQLKITSNTLGGKVFFESTFESSVSFGGAIFHQSASFEDATFLGGGSFDKAKFHGGVGFDKEKFMIWAEPLKGACVREVYFTPYLKDLGAVRCPREEEC